MVIYRSSRETSGKTRSLSTLALDFLVSGPWEHKWALFVSTSSFPSVVSYWGSPSWVLQKSFFILFKKFFFSFQSYGSTFSPLQIWLWRNPSPFFPLWLPLWYYFFNLQCSEMWNGGLCHPPIWNIHPLPAALQLPNLTSRVCLVDFSLLDGSVPSTGTGTLVCLVGYCIPPVPAVPTEEQTGGKRAMDLELDVAPFVSSVLDLLLSWSAPTFFSVLYLCSLQHSDFGPLHIVLEFPYFFSYFSTPFALVYGQFLHFYLPNILLLSLAFLLSCLQFPRGSFLF